MTDNRRVVGLTGGIGSGKSTVADEFARLGAAIIDTDVIAHELTGPGGKVIAAIAARFGPAVIAPDGRLDRVAMRQRVFDDPGARKDLEAILHPKIRAVSDARVHAALCDQTVPYVVLVVPLLIESGTYRERVEHVIVVDCSEATQIARVMARSGLSREQVTKIMAAQADRAARLAAADMVIDNDGDRQAMASQVGELNARLRMKSSVFAKNCVE